MNDNLTLIIKLINKRQSIWYEDYTDRELAIELCNIVLEELEIDIEDIEEEL